MLFPHLWRCIYMIVASLTRFVSFVIIICLPEERQCMSGIGCDENRAWRELYVSSSVKMTLCSLNHIFSFYLFLTLVLTNWGSWDEGEPLLLFKTLFTLNTIVILTYLEFSNCLMNACGMSLIMLLCYRNEMETPTVLLRMEINVSTTVKGITAKVHQLLL